MFENKLDFTNTEKKIVSKYTKIHKFIFRYSIFIIIWLISIYILSQQINKTPILDITDNFVIEKAKLIWEFHKIIEQNTNNENINIHILQWTLEMADDFIFSTNNLIWYKWLIMPNTLFAENLANIKSKEYFEKEDYDVKDLETFTTNILFTNSDQITKEKKNHISLPLNGNITNTFYLRCINTPTTINTICSYYIDNFLDTFFIYDIQQDYKWLIDIFNTLKKTTHKENLCKSMNKYILYSNDTNEKLENIFIECWQNYYQNFHTLQLFLDIQNQLQKWYINKIVYQNKILNHYKLISYQQIIYNDIHQNIVNNIRFETYINYLQELLKKENKIDWFYIDLSYWLNNNHLINILNKTKYEVSDKKKIEIDNIINSLNKLNNGDQLIWYAWLKNKLTNKSLEKNNDLDSSLQINQEQQDIINKLLEWTKELSFFKIISDKISWDKIKISWYFSIETNEWINPIYTSLMAEMVDNDLIINNIKLNWYEELNKIIGEIIKTKKYTISEIYTYIQNNIGILSSNNKISTCELISNTINKMKEWNKNISELNLMGCDSNKISVFKTETLNKKVIKTYYKLTLDNFNITDIMISDKELESDISNYLSNINTNNITISSMVWEILNYKPETKEYIQQGSNNIIITLEDFELYLWTIPDDIVEWTNQIISEFTIQWIKFIWNYDITSKKLWPLYFKNNLAISDFELYLTSNNQNKINEFLIDPLKYIQKTNSTIVNEYLKSEEE